MENKLIVYIIWAGLIIATVVNAVMLFISVRKEKQNLNINDREWE